MQIGWLTGPIMDEERESGAGGGGLGDEMKSLEARIARAERSAAAESKARQAAEQRGEQRERESVIRTELSKHQFAKPNGLDAAVRILGADIKRDHDGSLVTPDGRSISEYLGAKLNTEYDYLLAPKPVGGAGAQAGRGAREIDIDSIRPGMSSADLEAVRRHIADLARQRQ